jgi:2-polyprenyl-3-methyl-5-hydroxy-6-metoxy-1,4-benzoquinol methylase
MSVTDRAATLPMLSASEDTEAALHLRRLMRERYVVSQLKTVSPAQFERHIKSLPGRRDPEVEGYGTTAAQRDLSVQFEWGHNHDFGTFAMPGLMQDRHIHVLATFMTLFGVPAPDLTGKSVLDVGCWTGGTSLLLAAMGARVLAIDEVVKYADCVAYLRDAFGVENLEVQSRSLYSLDEEAFAERFDLVLYSGVLYHVSDPVLSLRILFNCLRDGGQCLVETMAVDGPGSFCGYGERRDPGSRDPARPETLLGGWAWFVPSLAALTNMLADSGFRVRGDRLLGGNRAVAVAERARHADMLRAGLSKASIR